MTNFTPKQREQLDAMARKIRERREQATGKHRQLVRVWQPPWYGVYGHLIERDGDTCKVERLEGLGIIEVDARRVEGVR